MSNLGDSPHPIKKYFKPLGKGHGLVRTVTMTTLCVLLALALSEIYRAMEAWGIGGWQGAAVFHALVGSILIVRFYFSGTLSQRFALVGVGDQAPRWFAERPMVAYAPVLGLVLGASLLGCISSLIGNPPHGGETTAPLAWIWLIPLVEEIFFRGLVGGIYRKLLPGMGGIWLSAATFALAHAAVTFDHLVQGQVGLPIGPFLLGLLCESVYLLSGSLLPGILVHAAANATVLIFQMLDPRWLEWLGLLYI
jgi:membrane protease YdiL (CAAX protease family)